MSMNKQQLLNHYITTYTPNNRMGFLKLCLTKYKFEKYSLRVKNEDIKEEDRIVTDKSLKEDIQTIINTGKCSINDFTCVFNQLTVDQIIYIGY